MLFGLTREAHDDVGGNADLAFGGANQGDFLEIFLSGIGPRHGPQNLRRARLYRQVHVLAEFWLRIHGGDDVGSKVARVRCGVTHAANPRDFRDRQQQFGKFQLAGRGVGVGIHGLTQQLDLGVTQVGELPHFAQNSIAGAAAFRAAGKGHDAVGAGFVAAFDDGEKGAKRIVAAGDFGLKSLVGVIVEAGDAALAGFQFVQHFREMAITSGTAHETNPRRSLKDVFALLLGYATEHADDFVRVGGSAEFAQAGEYLLRSFFANTAGVIEDYRGVGGLLDLAITAGDQYAGHFFRVVVVHLAT